MSFEFQYGRAPDGSKFGFRKEGCVQGIDFMSKELAADYLKGGCWRL